MCRSIGYLVLFESICPLYLIKVIPMNNYSL